MKGVRLKLAGFAIKDYSQSLLLSLELNAYSEYQPNFMLSVVRPPQQKEANYTSSQRNVVATPLSLEDATRLANHLKAPNEFPSLEIRNIFNSQVVIERINDGKNLYISSNHPTSGTRDITLSFDEAQFKALIDYLGYMVYNASLIKEIGRNVRMQMINLLRELGIDTLNPNNNQYRTTQWYDGRFERPAFQQRSNSSNMNNSTTISPLRNQESGMQRRSFTASQSSGIQEQDSTNRGLRSAQPTNVDPAIPPMPPMADIMGSLNQTFTK